MSSELKQFCRIPCDFILKYGEKIPCDIYLRLSETKIVKLSHKDDITSMLKKYQAKGVKEVYANREQFIEFIEFVKKSSKANRFFDYSPDKSAVTMANRFNQGFKLVQESMVQFGVDANSIALAKNISKSSYKVMQSVPNIFSFFKELATECECEFMRVILIGYTACCMLENFSWQSISIKEKIFLASFLCELTLDKNNLEMLAQWERGELQKSKLSAKVLDHPKTILKLLSHGGQRSLGKDILTIVEHHHEKPDKLGFPYGLGPDRMTPLTCIYIVARHFALLIEKHGFQDSKRSEILYQIEQRYSIGNYKKAAAALDKMFAA